MIAKAIIKNNEDLLNIAIDSMSQCVPIARVKINKQLNEYQDLLLSQANAKESEVAAKVNALEAKLISKISREQHIESTVILFVDILNELGSGFIYTTGGSYIYNTRYWQEINQDQLKQVARRAAIAAKVPTHIASSSKFIKQLVEDINIKHYINIDNIPKHNLINLRNCTLEVDVNNGSVRKLEFDKNNYLFYQLNYDYDDSAICPQFSTFLNQVLPSATAQAVIAETIGSTFIPNEQLKLEKMPVLIGKGANGKSVLLEIIREVLGEDNVSHIGISSLTTNEQAKAGLRNKLLNIDSEMTSVFNRINYEELKKIISGEPIQVKLLFKDMFKISNYAKMIAACNELPPHEHTNAFARRLLVVPFNITIPLNKQDPQLAYKIKTTEMAGIFNWVLQGFMRIARQKHFTESREIIAAGIEYAIDSDSVQQYIRDGLELVPATDDPSNFFGLSTLFRNYVAYCAEVGLKSVSRRTMEKRLIAAGCGRDPRGFYFKTPPKEMQRNLDINDLPI